MSVAPPLVPSSRRCFAYCGDDRCDCDRAPRFRPRVALAICCGDPSDCTRECWQRGAPETAPERVSGTLAAG